MEQSLVEQTIHALHTTDERIVQLLKLRYHLAAQLAQVSSPRSDSTGLEERLSAIMSRLARNNPGPLGARQLAAIFEMVVRVTEPFASGLSANNDGVKKG